MPWLEGPCSRQTHGCCCAHACDKKTSSSCWESSTTDNFVDLAIVCRTFFLLSAVLGKLENGFDRLQLGKQFAETMIDWDEVIFVHLGAIFFWDRPLNDADNFAFFELRFGGSIWIPWEVIVETPNGRDCLPDGKV